MGCTFKHDKIFIAYPPNFHPPSFFSLIKLSWNNPSQTSKFFIHSPKTHTAFNSSNFLFFPLKSLGKKIEKNEKHLNSRKNSKTCPEIPSVYSGNPEFLSEKLRSPTFSNELPSIKPEENTKEIKLFKKESKSEIKSILKQSFSHNFPEINQITEINPFQINLLDLYNEKKPHRSSSLLSEFQPEATKINPTTNLLEFFKEKTDKEENFNMNSLEISSFYSSNSPNSIRKTKKSATFSLVLHPSFDINHFREKQGKEACKKKSLEKKISRILANVPKARSSLSLKFYDKINQYILLKDINRWNSWIFIKKFSLKANTKSSL